MAKYIWARIGTDNEHRYKAMRKRQEPKIGDELCLRGFDAWEDVFVRVVEIKTLGNHVVHYCTKI